MCLVPDTGGEIVTPGRIIYDHVHWVVFLCSRRCEGAQGVGVMNTPKPVSDRSLASGSMLR